MRVLVVSKFLHHVGGVETYVAWLARNLKSAGAEVAFFGMRPPPGASYLAGLDGQVFLAPYRNYHADLVTKVRSAVTSVYSPASAQAIGRAVEDFAPDVVHFQGTGHQLTSAVVSAVARRGVPMISTAHEYALVCSNARLWDDRKEAPCTKCVGAGTAERMGHISRSRCVKGAAGPSVLAAAEVPLAVAVWRRAPILVHAPSLFMKSVLETEGSPVRDRVRYLDLAWGEAVPVLPASEGRREVVYLGRLSQEKGVDSLITAWPQVAAQRPDVTLRIFGEGGDEARLRRLASGIPRVVFAGRYERSALAGLLETAAMTVHPSLWAENSPYTVRESLQHGVPAVVSDQGGLPEMVDHATGTVFPAGNVRLLAKAVIEELGAPRAGSPELTDAVRRRAVSDAQHLEGLLGLYEEAADLIGPSGLTPPST